MKPGYTIVDHPSDIGIRAHGATAEEAFEEAGHALISIIADPASVRRGESHPIELAGSDREHLLVLWLSEILYWYDGRGFIAGRCAVERIEGGVLRGRIEGEPFDAARHHPRLDVKAVTYHQIAVRESGDGVTLHVTLDI